MNNPLFYFTFSAIYQTQEFGSEHFEKVWLTELLAFRNIQAENSPAERRSKSIMWELAPHETYVVLEAIPSASRASFWR